MNTEEEVCATAMRFYDGLNDLLTGKGLAAIDGAWEHSDRVTGGHPNGEWSQGWDEIRAGFETYGSLARHDRGGAMVRGMKAHVYGDVAYTTCLFTSAPVLGAETLACTNVLRRVDGAWKIIHHHADKAPKLAAAAEKIARGE